MDLAKVFLEDFLNEDPGKAAPASGSTAEDICDIAASNLGALIRIFGPNNDYKLCHVKTQAGDIALCHNGDVIGAYITNVLIIKAAHHGNKLSVPLVLEAVKHRNLPGKRTLSEAGKKALTRAWDVANGKCVNPWP